MALPEAEEESDPAFMHHGADALPVVEAGGARARLIAGSAFGETSPLTASSETLYADVELAAGARMPIDATYEERALYTIAGHDRDRGRRVRAGPAPRAAPGRPDHRDGARRGQAARFMLFGGAPMEGPRYIWWNFVSSPPRAHRAGQGGVGARPLRHRAGRRGRLHPAAREGRRAAARHGRRALPLSCRAAPTTQPRSRGPHPTSPRSGAEEAPAPKRHAAGPRDVGPRSRGRRT